MAKMFYTLEEAAEKLQKTPDEVKEMAQSGQIQEFRDRDQLMFKVEQINLLSGADEETTGEVHLDLEDTGSSSAIGLSSSGLDLTDESAISSDLSIGDSAIGLADSLEGASAESSSGTASGISVFDTGHGEEVVAPEDQSSETVEEELSLDSVGSGSGLLDLTRESDDTSLGAELLEEVYSSEDNIEIPAHASGLFEAATDVPADEPEAAPSMAAAMPMVIEAYDGTGSGLGAGLLIGAMAAMICVAIIVAVGVMGSTAQLATMIAENLWMWVGGLAGITILCGLIGLFLGKSSE